MIPGILPAVFLPARREGKRFRVWSARQDQKEAQENHGKMPEIAVQSQHRNLIAHPGLVRKGKESGQQAEIRQKICEHSDEPGEKRNALEAVIPPGSWLASTCQALRA